MALLAAPHFLNSRKDLPLIDHQTGVGYWKGGTGLAVEDAGVAGVQVRLCQGRVNRRTDRIARLVADELEDVCTDVPAAEGVQAPVRLDRRDFRVVGIEGGIGGALQGLGDSVAEEDGVDFIRLRISFVFVEGEEDEGVLHEVLVREEGGEEAVGPGAGKGDVGVVAVVGHVGRDKHPLRELVSGEVGVELGEVFYDGEAVLRFGD